MKMDYSDMLRDADMMKKGIRRTVKEMKKNDLEFSVRFSWSDVLMVVAGICAVLIVFGWIKKIENLYFVVKQGGFDFDYWYMESAATKIPQEPFKGVASAIPGKIEAEDYDKGGHNKAFYDNDRTNKGGAYREDEVDIVALDSADTSKGYALGYTEDGEWVEYTVNNQIASEYTVVLNVATQSEDVGVQFFIDDKEITDVIKVPQGDDWNTYSKVEAKTKEIPKGEHVLKMQIVGNYVNIDWFKFCMGFDCDDNVSIRNQRIELPIAEKSYAVFSMTGKYLGHVDAKGQSLAKPCKVYPLCWLCSGSLYGAWRWPIQDLPRPREVTYTVTPDLFRGQLLYTVSPVTADWGLFFYIITNRVGSDSWVSDYCLGEVCGKTISLWNSRMACRHRNCFCTTRFFYSFGNSAFDCQPFETWRTCRTHL